jgi:phosphoserine phosphatase RsbU/P
VSLSVEGFLTVRGEVLATPDLHDDTRFPGLRGKPTRVRSLLAVPLRVGGQMTGMLAVTQPMPGRHWMPDEIQLMTIVANSSAGVLEQARLRLEAAERARLAEAAQRMDAELAQAREIQMGLVPASALRMAGWEAVGRIDPARMVGGDAFNFYPLGEDRFAVAIADVSGKGVPASLLMSSVQASLRAYCDGRREVPDAMQHLNRSVARSARHGKFITFFYAEIDPQAKTLRYSNAGHNYPLLRRADGSLEPLKTGGLPLGLFEDGVFAEGRTGFGPGDALLLYSDGVSEAINTAGEDFGEERLERLWSEHGAGRPQAVVDLLMHELAEFRGPAAQNDDVTLVVVGGHSG